MDKRYLAIDLKSFYASVECVERGLDPLRVNLVVADETRTNKTICLAVSPPLKARGVSSRPRLFEVEEQVKQINAERKRHALSRVFSGTSYNDELLNSDQSLSLDFIVAPPRMSLYMKYSARIFEIYQTFVAPEDIHVYSIDEVFMDVTAYLSLYQMTAFELAAKIVKEVFETTGITATAGVGSNLYLAKVAMDIVAKHAPPDENGVRIAELDEESYKRLLWDHRPLTDFWRVGRGYARRLEANGMFTMGDVARRSIAEEDDLFRLFGVNAELLIDHAWGVEPVTIEAIKKYRPSENSLGAGQVLKKPYPFEKAKLVLKEMAEGLVFDLLEKGLSTRQVVLTVGYDRENLQTKEQRDAYFGEVTFDRYGREIPWHGHGTERLKEYTSSTKLLVDAAVRLFCRVTDPTLTIRRMYLCFAGVKRREEAEKGSPEQLDLFSLTKEAQEAKEKQDEFLEKERKMQEAVLKIRKKFGSNALVKGMNLEEDATAIERNDTIGGHKK